MKSTSSRGVKKFLKPYAYKRSEQQMQAERERRAKILKAEGEKASMILQ